MYIQAILSTVQTKLRGKLKLNLNLGICGSGMLRVGCAGAGDYLCAGFGQFGCRHFDCGKRLESCVCPVLSPKRGLDGEALVKHLRELLPLSSTPCTLPLTCTAWK